jgi:hypothetical protein
LANTDASSTSRYCNCYIRDIYIIVSTGDINSDFDANANANANTDTDSNSNSNTNLNSRSVI